MTQLPRKPSPVPLVLAGAALALAAWVTIRDFRGPWSASLHRDAAPRAIEPRGSLSEFEKVTVEISENNAPSVVGVVSPGVTVPGRYRWERIPAGAGTGFVWSEDGYIVTNNHVVQGRKSVSVQTVGMQELEATVVGTDPSSDIAVLKLSDASGLRPVLIGTSDDLKVGQAVFAIGNPYGFDFSLTTGVISALQRSLETDQGVRLDGLIQVDASINPGNSGGPLLDSAGRLIGMNTAIYSPTGSSAGIGFAVPVDTINRVVPRIIAGENPAAASQSDSSSGDPDRATLGVYLQVDRPVRFMDGTVGIEVTQVIPNSGAADAGLRGSTRDRFGDVLVAIDGEPTRSFDDVRRILSGHAPGDQVEVVYVTNLPRGRRVRAMVTLSRPGSD